MLVGIWLRSRMDTQISLSVSNNPEEDKDLELIRLCTKWNSEIEIKVQNPFTYNDGSIRGSLIKIEIPSQIEKTTYILDNF